MPLTLPQRNTWTGFFGPLRGALLACVLATGSAEAQQGPESVQDSSRADQGWPREYVSPEGHRLLAFQPQVESWDDYTVLNMRVAVALIPLGSEEPILGAVRVEADTETNLEDRTVVVYNHELHEATFPGLDQDSSTVLLGIARTALPEASRTISLDRVLAYMDQPLLGQDAGGLSVDPPAIFVSEDPARLLLFDGEPIMSPIDGTDLLYALNTNWDVFLQSGESRYYVRDESVWYAADDYRGPWFASEELPEGLLSLPDDGNWVNVKASFPVTWVVDDQVPEVFVSTTPAELIALDGGPQLVPIDGTDLLSATNTDQDLFFHAGESRYYFLVSGRWFSTDDLAGDWAWVEELPADFAAMPDDHARAHVLASVPGTLQAAEAVLLAQIPQKATVDRAQIDVQVTYSGEPEFRDIDGTGMAYAVNTASDVIRVGEQYYLCHQGVWFVSPAPAGPWAAAESVPDEIYTIPASSPVYHTTYVYVYDSTPTTITYGYTSGYTGMYIWGGTVIWGTGYYYNPWYGYGAFGYPYYYSYPYSYGAATWYNPNTGFYGRGAGSYGPYGGYGAAAYYNPNTGTYARGAAAYGPYGGTRVREAYNPRTGTYAASRQSRSPYAQWGGSVVTRGDDWAWAQHYSDSRGTVGTIRGSDGGAALGAISNNGSGFVGRNASGDVYAGRDGSLYRRDGDGWQQYGGGDWNQVDRSQLESRRNELGAAARDRDALGARERSNLYSNLERDRSARISGSSRANNWSANRGSIGSRRGSFGGGRRRR